MSRLLHVVVALACLAGCAAMPTGIAAPASRPTPVQVTTDPRIELISVVGLLGDYFLISQYDLAYKQEVRAYFAPFAAHPAVSTFKRLTDEGFAFSTVPDALLQFTAPPRLQPREVVSDNSRSNPKLQTQLAELMPLLRDFARASRFDRFYANQQPVYAAMVASTEGKVVPPVQALQAYTGITLANATVILGPLLHDGGFATKLHRRDGSIEAYALLGPTRAAAGAPDFGGAERIDDLVAHEFAHVIVNPLGDSHQALIQESAQLFPAIKEAMAKRGYDNWKTVVDEMVIRAITTRMVAAARGEAAGATALKGEVDLGYAYLPLLVEQLKTYEAQRDRYPTIASFYPVLVRALATASPVAAR